MAHLLPLCYGTILLSILLTMAPTTNWAFSQHRFRFGSRHWRSADSDEGSQQHASNEICANFSRDFFDEITSGHSLNHHPLFGWIGARGSVSFNGNRSALTVKCLALALSTTDLIVERKCIRTILPVIRSNDRTNSSINKFASPGNLPDDDGVPLHWHYGGSAEGGEGTNFTVKLNPEDGEIRANDISDGQSSNPLLLVQLRPHHAEKQNRWRSANFPCIFPFAEDDRLASRLQWNATVCGFAASAGSSETTNTSTHLRVLCHPLAFDKPSLGGNSTNAKGNRRPASIVHDRIHPQFLPDSALFLFTAIGPTVYLGGVGEVTTAAAADNDSVNGNGTFWTFQQNNCTLLAHSTNGRVHCAAEPEEEMMLLEKTMADGIVAADPPISATTSTLGPMPLAATTTTTTLRNSGLESAHESLAVVPLVVLSVIVTGGMLAGIIYFLVLEHQRIHYDAI